jgi:hypothetical protein
MKPFPLAPPSGHVLLRISLASIVSLLLVLSAEMSFARTESSATQAYLSDRVAHRAQAVSPNAAPFLTRPSDMSVTEGSDVEQIVTATDEDGQSLQFFKLDGPDFLSVATTSPGSGFATGRIHLRPWFIDAGSEHGTVGVSDGIAGARQSFAVSVADVPRAPSSMWSDLESRTYPTVNDPSVTRMMDLNGDGISDLVVGHNNSPAVSVFLGEGGATFHFLTEFRVPSLSSIALGDFTGDSRPDLAVMAAGGVWLAPGLGDGTFGEVVIAPAGSQAYAGASGDLNGDGIADLVVGNYDAGMVSVLLADGRGHLMAPVAYAAGSVPIDIELEDLNRDGNLDIAVANYGGSSVSVLLGNGAGLFSEARQYRSALNTFGLAVGDLNGDRWPDIVTAASGFDSLAVLLGTGGGAFQSPTWFHTGHAGSALAIRDFNADGRADLAFVCVGGVLILPGNGSGGFEPGFLTGAGVGGDLGASVYSTAIDLNEDGAADLVLPDRFANRILVVLSDPLGGRVLAARAFPSRPGPIQIGGQGPPFTCVSVEPVGGAYDNVDVNLSGFAMTSIGTGEVSLIRAYSGEIAGDTDGNGVSEIKVCFSREDLHHLFGGLNGMVTVSVGIEGSLSSGEPLQASLELRVKSLGTQSARIYPNPLNPVGTLSFETGRPGAVRVRLFDTQGRLIRTVLDDPLLDAGAHSVRVDGRDDAGNPLSSGVFFYQVESPERVEKGRFTLVK